MTGSASSRWWLGGAAAVLIGVALWLAPPFRVVSLSAAREQVLAAAFDPRSFADRFWEEELPRVWPRAIEAGDLVAGLRNDPEDTARRHGRRLGLSRLSTFLVAGTGWIEEVTPQAVIVVMPESEPEVIVRMATGPVFGNAVRDGSGLLDVNDFPNSQDFNALSAELNRRVEEEVLAVLRAKAAPGRLLRWVGCVEVLDPVADIRPLRVVPIALEWP